MKKSENQWISQIQRAFSTRRETNEIDFKSALSDNVERLKEHINAFGNSDDGGVFVFGVTNSFEVDPATSNQRDQTIKTIAHLARDTQDPPLTVDKFSVLLGGSECLCIYVNAGLSIPVFIKDRTPLGGQGCFKRSGASTLPMPINEVRERLARSTNIFHDEAIVEESSIEQLNFQKVEQILKDFRASEGLSSRNIAVLIENNVVKGQPGHYAITRAGLLVFAKDPQSIRHFRNAHIEFQQFHGVTRETPLKKSSIYGTLPDQVDQAIDLLLQHVWVMPTFQGSRRVEIPSYDKTILREVIANSVVHRDYSKMHQPVKIALFTDRIEIENPGGLLPGLTPLNLIHKREWRNPTLAQLLEKFRIGEMDGQGIDRLYTATRRIKLPAPKFFDNSSSFKVVLSGPKKFDQFTPEEKRLSVLVMLILEDAVDNEGIRNAFDIDTLKASTLIKSLVEDGVVKSTTTSRKFAKYRLTDEYHQKVFG